MEIFRGYELSEFIDLMNDNFYSRQTTYQEAEESYLDYQSRVEKYNELYKQPLHKGQFIPCDDKGKVIFKGWTYGKATKDNLNHTFILDEYTAISTQDFIHWYDIDDNLIKTIGDLFEYTEGQLETQNINI